MLVGRTRPIGVGGGFLSERPVYPELDLRRRRREGHGTTAVIRKWQSWTWARCRLSDRIRRPRTHAAAAHCGRWVARGFRASVAAGRRRRLRTPAHARGRLVWQGAGLLSTPSCMNHRPRVGPAPVPPPPCRHHLWHSVQVRHQLRGGRRLACAGAGPIRVRLQAARGGWPQNAQSSTALTKCCIR